MENTNQKNVNKKTLVSALKTLVNIDNLKDLSNVIDGPKKVLMLKRIQKLNDLQDKLKSCKSALVEQDKLYESIDIISRQAYTKKRKILIQINKLEKQQYILKSNISKLVVGLIFDHACSAPHRKGITVDEYYTVVTAYENKEFKSSYIPWWRLHKIILNTFSSNNLKFKLEYYQSMIEGQFIYKFFKSNTKRLIKTQQKIQDKIKKHSEINDALSQTFANMRHAKYIKCLDKKSHHKSQEKIVETNNIIDLRNVTKYYYTKFLATKVLKHINLQIKPGEFVVILGPSGSGKTTLLNIISGMDVATYGATYVANKNLITKNDGELTEFRKDNVGYIFQQYGLLPNLNVRENIEISANLQKDKKKRLDIDKLLKTVGMYEHRNKFPHELSGGQQQRVAIARSMVKNPSIVFGDEPTGAIDEEMTKQILQLFVNINKKFKTTVVIVTHNPIFADLASRVIKVNSGNIAADIQNTNRKSVAELNWSL